MMKVHLSQETVKNRINLQGTVALWPKFVQQVLKDWVQVAARRLDMHDCNDIQHVRRQLFHNSDLF